MWGVCEGAYGTQEIQGQRLVSSFSLFYFKPHSPVKSSWLDTFRAPHASTPTDHWNVCLTSASTPGKLSPSLKSRSHPSPLPAAVAHLDHSVPRTQTRCSGFSAQTVLSVVTSVLAVSSLDRESRVGIWFSHLWLLVQCVVGHPGFFLYQVPRIIPLASLIAQLEKIHLQCRRTWDPGSIPGSGRSPGEGIVYPLQYSWVSLVAQLVKNPPATQETWVQSLGREDPLEKRKANISPIFWPREFHGLFSPWGCKELDTTEKFYLYWLTHIRTLTSLPPQDRAPYHLIYKAYRSLGWEGPCSLSVPNLDTLHTLDVCP